MLTTDPNEYYGPPPPPPQPPPPDWPTYADIGGGSGGNASDFGGTLGAAPSDPTGDPNSVSGPGGWYRRGGPIPNRGSPRRDPVKITAHEGEFVVRPEMAAKYRAFLEMLNSGRL